jgi:hypothetical protein
VGALTVTDVCPCLRRIWRTFQQSDLYQRRGLRRERRCSRDGSSPDRRGSAAVRLQRPSGNTLIARPWGSALRPRKKTRTSTPRSPASPMQSPEQSTGSPATKGSLVGHGTANPSDLAALRHCCARPGAGSASGTPDTSSVTSSIAVDLPGSDFGDAGLSPSAHATATNTTRAQMLRTSDVIRRPSTRSECPIGIACAGRRAYRSTDRAHRVSAGHAHRTLAGAPRRGPPQRSSARRCGSSGSASREPHPSERTGRRHAAPTTRRDTAAHGHSHVGSDGQC